MEVLILLSSQYIKPYSLDNINFLAARIYIVLYHVVFQTNIKVLIYHIKQTQLSLMHASWLARGAIWILQGGAKKCKHTPPPSQKSFIAYLGHIKMYFYVFFKIKIFKFKF